MSDPKPSPVNRAAAFLLGFSGFLAFAFLSVLAVTYFRDRGTGYEDARSKARQEWRAVSETAQASVRQTAWKDQAAGVAQVSASDYLPIAAKALTGVANSPRPMQGDQFIVPGTPTFEAFTARQAAEAAGTPPPAPDANAPAPAPAPSPAPN